jgi:hypothetical protein
MLLQLACPILHYIAIAHSVMQYCEIHDFGSLQIHVQGPERRGRRLCQPPGPTAMPARSAAAASTGAPQLGRGLRRRGRTGACGDSCSWRWHQLLQPLLRKTSL